jgi:hypothetical protein
MARVVAIELFSNIGMRAAAAKSKKNKSQAKDTCVGGYRDSDSTLTYTHTPTHTYQ